MLQIILLLALYTQQTLFISYGVCLEALSPPKLAIGSLHL